MTEEEKIELFDKWYDENYDEWAEGEEGIALREELEQAFKGGIAELEQENKRLTDELKTLRESIKDYGAGCYENGLRNGKRKFEEQIADLEKENAVLKEQVNILDNCDRLGDVITEAYKEQLTKAKEIIKNLMVYVPVDLKEYEEAKQLISEVKND